MDPATKAVVTNMSALIAFFGVIRALPWVLGVVTGKYVPTAAEAGLVPSEMRQ